MKTLSYIAIVMALLAFSGCAQVQPTVLGTRPSSNATVTIASLKKSASAQTIAGTMIDKCPVAGCWFHVKDASGVIKVDTRDSGFVVLNVPVNSHVVVAGVVRESDEQVLSATGMTYE